MKLVPTKIPDVLLMEPEVFEDKRGFILESFNKRDFLRSTGVTLEFVQENHSRSYRNALRGLHYQVYRAQGKLIRVVTGEIFDVAVDLRKWSSTFGQWVGSLLTADNRLQCWIPPGFAHGFLTLSDVADCLYKTTDYRISEFERCIIWNDSDLEIKWPLADTPILSERDMLGLPFSRAEVFA